MAQHVIAKSYVSIWQKALATANLKKKKDWKQSMTASFSLEVLKQYENHVNLSFSIIAQCYSHYVYIFMFL